MPFAAILNIIGLLLPEIIKLAHAWDDTPEEKRREKIMEIRTAMKWAEDHPGDTSKIEDQING